MKIRSSLILCGVVEVQERGRSLQTFASVKVFCVFHVQDTSFMIVFLSEESWHLCLFEAGFLNTFLLILMGRVLYEI